MARDLPAGFDAFFQRLHHEFAPRQRQLAAKRNAALGQAHGGELPTYLAPSEATRSSWKTDLPSWCTDQRNQMTGPADDAELVVKMLNSGAPGVMLDLEDSMANTWPNLMCGIHNVVAALYGTLTYKDVKRGRVVAIAPSQVAVWTRVRGLHLSQGNVLHDEATSASLFDLALLAYGIDASRLKHPLAIYIPKSESAEEALWWEDVFGAIEASKGWAKNFIRCMALVESHPLAFQLEEFMYNLRHRIVGLNLGRWDYMASLIHYNLHDPEWVLPDRNTIPLDVAFFQNLRMLLPEVCHKHGILAIGGMTALYPSREDPELNARALAVLERDKKNEAQCRMDGAWTGHPDQNSIAVEQFPFPNQVHARVDNADLHPELRPLPHGVGAKTLDGTRAAVRTVIRYRNGVLEDKGASLLDGYMEDLATDRIYRLMIAQRVRFPGDYTPASLDDLFNVELKRILDEAQDHSPHIAARYTRARKLSEQMIRTGAFNPT
ncbi:MAG: hypothetical protein M3160_06855 [Candidatus Eremiobacteraeota bacterium]|nr:hypothetical protein [Candidatus Eremiobacteraeota bacterium]